jgi:hypothetical protein
MKKEEIVYSILDRKRVKVFRENNSTLTTNLANLIDSDVSMLEDAEGYRYKRVMGFNNSDKITYSKI